MLADRLEVRYRPFFHALLHALARQADRENNEITGRGGGGKGGEGELKPGSITPRSPPRGSSIISPVIKGSAIFNFAKLSPPRIRVNSVRDLEKAAITLINRHIFEMLPTNRKLHSPAFHRFFPIATRAR